MLVSIESPSFRAEMAFSTNCVTDGPTRTRRVLPIRIPIRAAFSPLDTVILGFGGF